MIQLSARKKFMGAQKSARPAFFAGYLKKRNDKLLVTKLLGARLSINRLRNLKIPDDCHDGEFVTGCIPANQSEPPFIYRNGALTSPVFIVEWSDFEESKSWFSAREYFNSHESGLLRCTGKPLPDGINRDWEMVVLDVKGNVYYKGFNPNGSDPGVLFGRVQRYCGANSWIVDRNYKVRFDLEDGRKMTMLIPPEENEFKKRGLHSILGVDGWRPAFMPNAVKRAREKKERLKELQEEEMTKNREELDRHLGIAKAAYEVGRNNSSVKHAKIVGSHPWLQKHEDEEFFLKRFAEYRKRSHFAYSERDVVRFHTGAKLGLISLLAGEPGCGKSSLARLYANALSGKAQKPCADSQFIRIYVDRTWTTPYDMLGYPNREGTEVNESDNGLLKFLRKATESPEQKALRCVCFEEMNISQVEHYFSNFMQIFSGDDAANRDPLPGFGKGGADLRIGENLIFIGTCNEDNTVRQFSKRFLDRCNYVNLSSLSDEGGFETSFTDISRDDALEGLSVDPGQLQSWSAVVQDQRDALVKTKINKFFEKLKPLFRAAGSPLDCRAVHKISRYVCCRPSIGSETQSATLLCALDEALAQMVVPKMSFSINRNETVGKISNLMKEEFKRLDSGTYRSLTVDALGRQKELVQNPYDIEGLP